MGYEETLFGSNSLLVPSHFQDQAVFHKQQPKAGNQPEASDCNGEQWLPVTSGDS